MEDKKVGNSWVIVLQKGERIIEKLTEFIKRENIKSGCFHGLGAISSLELAHYNLEKKSYTSKSISEPLEIVSFTGNVARKGDEIIIHAHIAAGTEKMELYGGHLKEAVVAATCEVIFNDLEETINREYNDDIGLNLIRLR